MITALLMVTVMVVIRMLTRRRVSAKYMSRITFTKRYKYLLVSNHHFFVFVACETILNVQEPIGKLKTKFEAQVE
jgi:predicted LPLAT superfamily acyltransferase